MTDAPNDAATPVRSTWSGPGLISIGLFLITAVILFGTILSGYALVRINDPEAFAWAPKLLDRKLGLVSSASLAVSCLAAAGALRFALIAKLGPARGLLALALLAGLTTVSVRTIELSSATLRAGFVTKRAGVGPKPSLGAPSTAFTHVGDSSQGKRVFLGTCAACHAPDGSGVKGQGQNLRESPFVKDKTDESLLTFVKVGRQPFDPESKLHLSMPSRGGNPALTDANLLDAIAYVRQLQKQAVSIVAAPGRAAAAASPANGSAPSDQPQLVDGELWLPHSILPAAQTGPTGATRATVELQQTGARGRTASNIHRFFSLFLLAYGLHAIYLVFGLAFGLWLLFSTARGAGPPAPLSMAAVYWVVVGAIGLLLIPAFYV